MTPISEDRKKELKAADYDVMRLADFDNSPRIWHNIKSGASQLAVKDRQPPCATAAEAWKYADQYSSGDW